MNLGKKVPAATFAAKAKEVGADIIAVSVNTAPAKDNLSKLVPAIEAEGLKDRVAIMIGGAAVDKEDADKMGAVYGETREEAVALAKKIVEEKKG